LGCRQAATIEPACKSEETDMIKSTLIALFASAAALLAAPSILRAEEATKAEAASDPVKSGRIAANGVDYYYEIHGEGEPLLLLHGGLGSIDMFGPVLPALSERRQVIAVDLHGHGRTALGERDIDLVDIGDDLAVVLGELGYEKVDALGYSFGGGAAFRLAVQHPDRVRHLAIVSAGYSDEGFYPEIKAQQVQVGAAMADMMKETPMYQSYVAVAPKPEEFPKLLDQMGNLMRKSYDWSADVEKLKMPVMLVFGDSDMYRPEHVIKFYQLLGGGLKDAGWMRENLPQNRLAIIPNRTHYDMFFAPELAGTVLPFLNGETAVKSWAEQVEAAN
jgi:pimeloyl-ACP methyl ester carboxylesterase